MPKNTSKLLRTYKGSYKFRDDQRVLDCRAMSCSKAQDHKQREGPQHRAEGHPQCAKASESPTGKRNFPETWPEEPVVARHASPRNDEEAFERPLERPVSFRATNIGGPTFQAHQEFQFHGHLLSVLSFLLSWVDLAAVSKKGPTGGLICGGVRSGQRVSTT